MQLLPYVYLDVRDEPFEHAFYSGSSESRTSIVYLDVSRITISIIITLVRCFRDMGFHRHLEATTVWHCPHAWSVSNSVL
jgi:hypothetical protein